MFTLQTLQAALLYYFLRDQFPPLLRLSLLQIDCLSL